VSAQREVSVLWSRCAALRRRIGSGGAALDPSQSRLVDELIGELRSATRRLESAGMLTPPRAGHLTDAVTALTASRADRLPARAAVERCMRAVEELAASYRVPLPGAGDDTGSAEAAGSPAAFDYDTNPQRFRTALAVTRRHSRRGDIHGQVAARLAAERAAPVIDAGCGNGRLLSLLVDAGIAAAGVDRSRTMLCEAPGRRILGDVRALPLPDAIAGAVASLYVLNHLPDPAAAVAEAWRVLRPGGLYVVAAVSRRDAPEIAGLLPPAPPATFDAELAPGLLAAGGFAVETEVWDVPGGLVLPDSAAIQAYLIGRILPPNVAARLTSLLIPPLEVTRRGALVLGRKPG
jgi:SAM-dependent methyltransferase